MSPAFFDNIEVVPCTDKLIYVDPYNKTQEELTYAELVHGVEKSTAVEKNRLALSMLLANIEILDFDVDAANCYGKIRAEFC